ncbi:MAG: universal stress protein [Chloracidobacterium sp.]|nr:universal stress protein [Chloracidobacterium sp.]
MRILIGYNGSDAARAALQDLRYAGFPDDTEALLLTVSEFWLEPKTADEATAIALAGKDALSSEFPTWTITAETASGSPPREILARAESFGPDVIIVGEPSHMTSSGNIFVGHTSQTILTEAGCSVRIARQREGTHARSPKILVGFDGSAGAIRIVDSIARRVWSANTQVRLLAVADASVLGMIGRFTPQMKNATVEAKFAIQWAETLAAASLEKLESAGVSSSIEVRLGNPKYEIIEEAENWNADAVFVGPHCAPDSFERFLIGSVSIAVASRASCSVEVVRKS